MEQPMHLIDQWMTQNANELEWLMQHFREQKAAGHNVHVYESHESLVVDILTDNLEVWVDSHDAIDCEECV